VATQNYNRYFLMNNQWTSSVEVTYADNEWDISLHFVVVSKTGSIIIFTNGVRHIDFSVVFFSLVQ